MPLPTTTARPSTRSRYTSGNGWSTNSNGRSESGTSGTVAGGRGPGRGRRHPVSSGHHGRRPTPDQQLARYRASIDNIDAALIHLLAERFKITQDVGRYKAASGLPAADPAREERQVTRLRALAEEAGLDPVFSEKFLRFIVAEVIHHHQRIAEHEGPASD